MQGFWSKETIHKRVIVDKDDIIVPKHCDRVDLVSYHLAVGEEVFVSPNDPELDEPYRNKRFLKDRETCVIPPGQFALLMTEETVKMPNDVIGFISLRSKHPKFKGLINVSGFHVDPNYHGKLIFAVFNAGPMPVHVARGDLWFSIFFAGLTEPVVGEIKKGYESIPSDLLSSVSSEFPSLDTLNKKIKSAELSLTERIHKVESEQTIVRWALLLVVGAIIAWGVKQLT